MKPSKTFKIAKSTKRMLALMKYADVGQRTAHKHMMIEAQLASEVRAPREKKQ